MTEGALVRSVPTIEPLGFEATVGAEGEGGGEGGRATEVAVEPGTRGTFVVAAVPGGAADSLAGVTGAGDDAVVEPAAGTSTRISLPQLQR